MFQVDLYVKVLRAVMVENKSKRAVARYFVIPRKTARKMCQFAATPCYLRAQSAISPTLARFAAIINVILEAGKQIRVKQRHTVMTICERLRETRGCTIVREYANGAASRQKEVFMRLPL